jgi:hypothetical protein
MVAMRDHYPQWMQELHDQMVTTPGRDREPPAVAPVTVERVRLALAQDNNQPGGKD